MTVRVDITDIVGNKQKIADRIEAQYPYIAYMPINKGQTTINGRTYVILDVLSCD